MNIATALARSASAYPRRAAVLRGADVLHDYGELADRVARLAGYLRTLNELPPGARVLIALENSPEYLECLYGALWAGLVVVPVNVRLHPVEIGYIARDCGARVVFASAGLSGELRTVLASSGLDGSPVMVPAEMEYRAALEADPIPLQDRDDDALAWLFYTSGTTGRPKGVMLTHANLHAMAACFFSDVDSIEPADCHVYAAPMSHGAGLYSLPYMMRGCRHLVPKSTRFDVEELVELSATVGSLCMFLAPTMLKWLVEYLQVCGVERTGFRTLVIGGAPIHRKDLAEASRLLGPSLVQIYGQGESPMTITALGRQVIADRQAQEWDACLGSVGRAHALVEVRVVDDQGRTRPHGQSGEVVVRGPTVMKGYWHDEHATSEALRDGWLHTGDIGSMDARGYLTLTDRSKDVIISGGANIYPKEVEDVLLEFASVRAVSVVGQTDPEWGERVVAVVVMEGPVEEDADQASTVSRLDEHCLHRLARYKRPRRYVFLDELPCNSYGKVLKRELRQLVNSAN